MSAADEKLPMDYFTTYSARFTQLVDATLAVHGRAVIFDVHSYPEAELSDELSDELHGGGYRAPLCVGSEPFHASVDLLATVGGCFPDLDAQANAPFAGSYVPLKHYRSDARVSSVMLEIRRDVYLDEATVTRKPEGFAPLQVSLKRLVDQVRYG
ncbi:N-formylglutamate amidohydrolase [Cryobacterium sandaracinum]|uniref:N-formylglutamate amidohydrolase n=1 Tax=Cryobacterium sandaracinum TaxID=1259247 RepID=UPI001F543D28|nr:N-formylglutamate amidohydrolase [Cryobacterium sandaracinum]